ncbi:MAG: CDP-diacylglycerol--glycerol-3-phosphate 3-phosphatidyltransferase [Firmicutes bacterium HGW-Firmicutes-16]|nr:MAG: CDP-diacylglycerol--glycerol-3-phosphate 3-phosphatidyltransferase [Firmicutes bacterium HGW-Firmicutes-16]
MTSDRCKEIFSIPNILGYFRILLIPFFMYTYLNAKTVSDYYAPAVLVGVSSITDMFDGLIARKFNMVTELGKLIDPFADKLTQGALIICFIVKYQYMRYLLALYLLKEGFMLVAGLFMLHHNGKKLNGAKWFGKVSTALVYVVMFILFLNPIFFPHMNENSINALILLCGFAMAATLALYVPVFIGLYREE